MGVSLRNSLTVNTSSARAGCEERPHCPPSNLDVVRPVLVYTLLRVLLFVVAFGVLYLLGLQNLFVLTVVAFLVSGVVSYVLLSKQRDAMSARLSGRLNRSKRHDD